MTHQDQIAAGFARLAAAVNAVAAMQGGAGVPAGGNTGQVLYKLSAADYDAGWIDPPAGADASVVIQDFVTPGSSLWVKPTGKKYHKLEMVGWGGPGGGGSALFTTSARFGGGPGSGGQSMSALFLDDELPATVPVVIGSRPVVGAGVLSNIGSAGTKGGDCKFGNLGVISGSVGAGGTSTSGAVGAATSSGIAAYYLPGIVGQAARISGTGDGGSNFSGCTGGGGGGGAPAGAGVAMPGRSAYATTLADGTVRAMPGETGPTITYAGREFGLGGGGGAYAPGAPGTDGAPGGFPGGGGGGGGASDAGFMSGNGGQGGGARVRIKSW